MKIQIKYCAKCEKVVERNFNLANETFSPLMNNSWSYPQSFVEKVSKSVLLFCNCGMWQNEDHFKTIEFDIDEEEFIELEKGDDNLNLIKKHIMLANLK